MNSVERVEAALNFSRPDKVPVWKSGYDSDIFSMVMMPSKDWLPGHRSDEEGLFPHTPDDMVIQSGIWKWKKPDWAQKNPEYRGKKWLKVPREEIDQWGAIWNRNGKNTSMGHPGRPSLPDWSKLDEYLSRFTPDPLDKSRFSVFLKMAEHQGKDKYRLGMLDLMGPFQTAQNMRGFNNFIIDHKKHPKELKYLLQCITENQIKCMDGWIKYGGKPHGFLLVEDLGSQKGPFFNPKMFKEFYKPVYGEIIKAAHDRGCTLFHHCCGKIDKVIPDLIEWGTDAIELDAPRMTGYDKLRPFRGKVMFWGCVNIQSIYVQGTPEECEREVWHMMRNLGTPDGGYGAYFYPQPQHILVPAENYNGFQKGLEKYGTYAKIPRSWWEIPTLEEWDAHVVPPVPPLKA